MRGLILAATIAATLTTVPPALAQYSPRETRERAEGRRDHKEMLRTRGAARKAYARAQKHGREDWRAAQSYDWNRPDPRYGPYKPERYWRDGRFYAQNLYLKPDDRIYRATSGRYYYCRRDDGTTGLVLGTLAGDTLVNVIQPGGSATLATVMGAGLGPTIGAAIARDGVRCR